MSIALLKLLLKVKRGDKSKGKEAIAEVVMRSHSLKLGKKHKRDGKHLLDSKQH
ncbi:MAG: hypothetical protein ACK5C9_21140 [Pseudanabaena sp.]